MPKPNRKISQREREICARLKEFREAIKWSQPDFAKHVDLTKDQLASIEYGRTPLRYDVAWKIRTLFGLSIDWLWGGDMGPADISEDEKLPPPQSTGMANNALLTEVFSKIYGADVNEVYHAPMPRQSRAKSKELEAEIRHRGFLQFALHLHLREWLSRIPVGYTVDFHDKMMQLAKKYLEAAPKVSEGYASEMFDALVWEEMKRDVAKRMSSLGLGEESALDGSSEIRNNASVMKLTLGALLDEVQKLTSERGMKARLASDLGVPPPRVNEWLSRKYEPSGEVTLRLLYWVEQQKRKK